MDTTIIICSLRRPAILHETVLALLKQSLQPASIVLSLCEETSSLPQTEELPRVHRILGPQGLPTQRNTAIPFVLTRYALFLDDDVELAHDYIEQMERLFAADPAIVSAFLSNGARGVNYRKRLIGNLMAYRDLLLCRIDPEKILRIADDADEASHRNAT